MPKKIKEEVSDEQRELAVRRFDSYGNYHIYREGGGVTPKELAGIYTTPTLAESALSRYKEMQGEVNVKKKLQAEIKAISELDHTYDEV